MTLNKHGLPISDKQAYTLRHYQSYNHGGPTGNSIARNWGEYLLLADQLHDCTAQFKRAYGPLIARIEQALYLHETTAILHALRTETQRATHFHKRAINTRV